MAFALGALFAAAVFCLGGARCAFAAPEAAAPGADVYVAPNGNDAWTGESPNPNGKKGPVATLHRAKEIIAEKLAAEGGRARDWTVMFRGGTYALAAKEIFASADSAGPGHVVSYASYPGESAVISAGRVLKGFALDPATGFWTLRIPEVAAGSWYFGEIWVNGKRAKWPIRPLPGHDRFHVAAQVESSGSAAADLLKPADHGDRMTIVAHSAAARPTNTDRFGFNTGEINARWTNLTDVMIRMALPAPADNLLHIKSVDEANHIVALTAHALGDSMPAGQSWRRENVYEDLGTESQVGEMYLDRKSGVLTYVPRPGETPSSATVVAPYAAELILISNARQFGTPGNLVGRISFSNISFAHTNSPMLSTGYVGAVTNCFENPLAAITVVGGTGVTLDHVTLTHLGEAAVMFGPGSGGNAIKNSVLQDIGSSAIIAGNEPRRNKERYPDNFLNGPSTPEWRVGPVTVSNNLIEDFGHVILNSLAVFAGRGVANSVISHNEISHGPAWAMWMGSDPGWYGAGQKDPLFPGPTNNVISWNYIHDLGDGGDTTAQDWGAIYTVGPLDGTVIEYNKTAHITTSTHPSWYGRRLNAHGRDGMILYNDDHTHGLTIRNNVFAGSQNFLHSFKGTGNVLDNNIFYSKNDASAYLGPQIFNMLNWQHYPAEQGQAFATLTHNLYVVDRGDSSAVPVLYFPVKSTGSTVTPDVVTSDNNLYFQVGATISNFASNATLANWKTEFGQDAHSLFNVDPLFVNPAAGDFRLKPGSPALGIGFVPFDLSAAGRK